MKTLWIRGNITWKTAIQVERALDRVDKESGLRLFVNSPGGETAAAFIISDLLRVASADIPISTVAAGEVYSCAPLIVCSARGRYSLPSTIWGLHYPYTTIAYQDPAAAKAEEECVDRFRRRMMEILAENSRLSAPVWTRRLAKKSMVYFSADEAFDYGLVDAVLTPEKRSWD